MLGERDSGWGKAEGRQWGELAMWTGEGADAERALGVGVLQKRSTDPSQLEQSRGLHVSICLGV